MIFLHPILLLKILEEIWDDKLLKIEMICCLCICFIAEDKINMKKRINKIKMLNKQKKDIFGFEKKVA